jgi:hypothetical protein
LPLQSPRRPGARRRAIGPRRRRDAQLRTIGALPVALGGVFEGDRGHLAHCRVHALLRSDAQQIDDLALAELSLRQQGRGA